MRTLIAQTFSQQIDAKKRALGMTEAWVDGARNSGERRTPEKRASLARMQERARNAGVEPMVANF
jgi:hypothetical protein